MIIGHRGAMGYRTENTLSSFQYAMELKLSMMELDVQMSRDGQLVVFHDRTLERLATKSGQISDYSLEELQKMALPDGEKIPSLEEVFAMASGKIRLNLEIKMQNISDKLSASIRDYLSHYSLKVEDVVVSSFDHRELLRFQSLLPEVPLAVLYYGIPVSLDDVFSRMNPLAVNLGLEFLDVALVKEIHSTGRVVNVYTVNEESDFRLVENYGVDGIFTNYPERFLTRS